jgi:hypothetical protein
VSVPRPPKVDGCRRIEDAKSDIIAKGIRFNYGRNILKKSKINNIGFFIYVGSQKNRIPLAIMSLLRRRHIVLYDPIQLISHDIIERI